MYELTIPFGESISKGISTRDQLEIIDWDMYGFKPFDRKIRSYVPWLADTEIKRPIAVNSFSN